MRKPTKISIIGDLSANDDFFHDTQDTENFMESNLFYFAGKTTSSKNIGGIIRIANRPNQGHADATVLYFPGDRSALFHYERPEISGNTSWRASGLEIDVVTPGGIEFRSSYHGDALHLKNPRLLANPKLAYQEPKRRLAIQLSHFGKSPMTELKYKRETMDAVSSPHFMYQFDLESLGRADAY